MIATKSNQETEASIKYFLSQALGSMLILLGIRILYQPVSQIIPIWIITVAILIKLGIAPCHFWYPSVIASLSWINCIILSTWQKLAPLSLLIITLYKTQSRQLLIIVSAINALIGGLLGINQTHLRPLLAYSSIGHIGWITSILSINKSIFCIIYFVIYSIVVLPIFVIINSINSKTIKTLHNLFKINTTIVFIITIAILSLAGVPPLIGFLPKLIIITKLIELNGILILFLLLGAYINLYYYLNITFNVLLSTNNISTKLNKKEINTLPLIITTSTSILGILPIII